jgi:hypothetical protein
MPENRMSGENLLRAIVITLILIYLLIAFSSCSPERKLQRLVKNHPELLKQDTVSVELPKDTVKINTVVDNFITDLDTLLQDTCITEETRIKIKTIIKEKLVPQIIKGVVPDTTIEKDGIKIIIKNGETGIQFDVVHSKVEAVYNDSFIDEKYYWWLIAFLLLVIFLLAYLNRK